MSNCCQAGKPAPDSYAPLGSQTKIGPVQVYESGTQESSQHERGLLLLLPDGFGLARHNQILADRFAGEGWHVIVPDYYEGDPVPMELLRRKHAISIAEEPWPEEAKQRLMKFDIDAWQMKHGHEHVSSLLEELIAELGRRYGNASLVGVGYCFGGKHVLRLAKHALKAAASFHPSFVQADDLAGIQAPVYIGLAENDKMVPASLPTDLQRWADSGIRGNTPFTIEKYPGMGHGFAARPDTESESIRKQYEIAFRRTVEHLSRQQ